jgi:metal-responsive CopG/Arc/MetJ family transcriptional regulator
MRCINQAYKSDTCVRSGITLPGGMVEDIDRMRNMVPRSRYISMMLLDYMKRHQKIRGAKCKEDNGPTVM